MNFLMSTSYESGLSSRLRENIPADTTFEFLNAEDRRFSIKFRKQFDSVFVHFVIAGSQARVYCELELSALDTATKNRVFSMLSFDACTLSSVGRKSYEFTLWKGKRDFKGTPSLKWLHESDDVRLELSSKPKQIHTPDRAADEIEKIMSVFVSWFEQDVLEVTPLEVPFQEEGGSCELVITKYERSKINREVCLKFYGTVCQICYQDMIDVYGEIAAGFIHVHHIEKLSESGPKVVDPISDLLPVCPNCHGIIHRTKIPATPEEVRSLIAKKR
jgi:hypothetical protein